MHFSAPSLDKNDEDLGPFGRLPAEPRNRQRIDARLAAPRQHDVSIAVLDHTCRVAHRVRAARARRDRRMVRALRQRSMSPESIRRTYDARSLESAE